jgi:hypothetical protein
MRARAPLRAPRASADGGPDGPPPVRTSAENGAERVSLDLEAEPLLAGKPCVGAPVSSAAADPIDWRATALLFFFPALGGALFGCVIVLFVCALNLTLVPRSLHSKPPKLTRKTSF